MQRYKLGFVEWTLEFEAGASDPRGELTEGFDDELAPAGYERLGVCADV